MVTIVIEPRGNEIWLRAAFEILRDAGITARKRSRSMSRSFVQVNDEDSERAMTLLAASNIRASIRPA